jgi:hypothetical protein
MVMLITGCATTTNISSVWKDQLYTAHPRKIMIIGIAIKPSNKRSLEDDFVRQFKMLDMEAVATYNIIPDEKDSDKELIAAKMAELGADAVLITRIASRESVYNYIPAVYSPPPYYATWQNYCVYCYNNLYAPGYVEETKYAVMETNVYDAANNQLIWSASSETEICGTDQKFIRSYVNTIVKKMLKQKLIR